MSMVITAKDGRVIQRSRNLAGIRAAVRKYPVDSVRLSRNGPYGGLLTVDFKDYGTGNKWDGAHFEGEFASYDVMKDFVSRWRSVQGTVSNPSRRKKPGAPSVKTVSLKNFTGKLRINPGVPAGAVVVTGVGSRANLSRKKSKKVAKFMVGSGVPAWKRKGKATLAKLRRNPAPRGFKVSGDKYARVYPSHEAAKKAARKFEERGFYTWIHGDPRGVRLAIKHYSKD